MEKNNLECVFCKIAKGEIPSEKVLENDNFFSVKDINPLTKGHSLVISKKHFRTILNLPFDLGQELVECIKETSLKIIDEVKCEGFNLAQNNFEAAGQVVHHLHFHIIPRNKDDGVKLN